MDITTLGFTAFGAVTGGMGVWAWLHGRQSRLTQALSEARQLSAESLKQQRAQTKLFHALFDAAPECIKLQTADGKVQRMNAAGLSLLETSQASQIVGKSVYSVIAPEYHKAYRQLTDKVFQGSSVSMEFELITFEGRRRWLETNAVPMRNDDGTVSGLLAITRDIDERKHMTRLLEEQGSRLRTIIESEPECVKLQDRDGTIAEMNPAGLSLLCAENPTQVVGSSIYDFLSPEYHEPYRDLTRAVFSGKRASMEFEVTTMEGSRRWLETHAAPLRDASGSITALLAITRDIHERKQQEEKLRNQRNELAHVCRLGTLGELASGLAHELNQPLCALSSYAESAALLNNRPYGRDVQKISEILHKIVNETERASGIIQRLRELVQRRVPQPQANSPTELVREALDIVEPERRRRAFHIELHADDTLPNVWVDRVQTEQVLINLLYNAMQAPYTESGKARIDVSIHIEDDVVLIRLRDYGDGIPPDIQPYLFTPFYTSKPDGIGMGLALSRSIAEAHGGSLNYQAADPGSSFSLGLPVVKLQNNAQESTP